MFNGDSTKYYTVAYYAEDTLSYEASLFRRTILWRL